MTLNGASSSLSTVNQNEFLLALNGLPCGDGTCDEGKNGGGTYNYKNFVLTKTDAGINAKMFYGQSYTTGTTVNNDTDLFYQIAQGPSAGGVYEDGYILGTTKSGGDATVPVKSSNGFALSNSMATSKTPAAHAFLPGAFAKEVSEWVSDSVIPASLQADVTINSRMNITLTKGTTGYLVDPTGKKLGVNPTTGLPENNILNTARATVDGNGVVFSLDNPLSGNYKLYIDNFLCSSMKSFSKYYFLMI